MTMMNIQEHDIDEKILFNNPNSKPVPCAEIYTEVYSKFDDECYYGMLNRKEFYHGLEFLLENEKIPPLTSA